MARSIMGKSLHTFAFQLMGQGGSIITGIILARELGPSGKGLVGYAAVVLSLITTFFDGQSEAIAYQAGRLRIPLRSVITATLQLLAMIVPLCMIAMIAFGHYVPGQAIVAIAAIALPFALIAQLSVPYFMLLDRITIANTQALAVNLFYLVLVAGALFIFHVSVTVVLGLWISTQVFAMALAVLRLQRLLRSTPENSAMSVVGAAPQHAEVSDPADVEAAIDGLGATGGPQRERSKRGIVAEQLIFATKSGLAAVAGYLNLRIDVFVVAAMLGLGEVGIYTLAIATGELMWKVAQAIIWSSLGRIASLPRAESARLTAKVTRHVFSIQFVGGVGIFIFAPLLMPLVYGNAFGPAGPALRAIVPGLIAYTMQGALGYYISVQMGRPLIRLFVQVFSVVLCAAISFALIPKFSIVGAAIATSISYLCVIAVMCTIFVRDTKLPLSGLFVLSRPEINRLWDFALTRSGIKRLTSKDFRGASS